MFSLSKLFFSVWRSILRMVQGQLHCRRCSSVSVECAIAVYRCHCCTLKLHGVQNLETCPVADRESNPCQEQPERAPWAEKKCNIINGDVFEACHAKVDPRRYYENCLYDTCGCDFTDDCECFCTSVATYAQVMKNNFESECFTLQHTATICVNDTA